MCFLAFFPGEPQGDPHGKTDSEAAGVGVSVVSVETPSISLREISYVIKRFTALHQVAVL